MGIITSLTKIATSVQTISEHAETKKELKAALKLQKKADKEVKAVEEKAAKEAKIKEAEAKKEAKKLSIAQAKEAAKVAKEAHKLAKKLVKGNKGVKPEVKVEEPVENEETWGFGL